METKVCVNWQKEKKFKIGTFCFVMFGTCEQCSVKEYWDKNYREFYIYF